jgi:hypothetical protein
VLELRRHVEGVDVVEVTARVRRAVAAELGLEVRTVVLVRAGGVPKTSSGKIQRWRCREWFLAGRLAEVSRLEAAASPAGFTAAPNADDVLAAEPARRPAMLAEYVRGQVAWLGGVDPGDLDPGQPLLAAGLDSLSLTGCAAGWRRSSGWLLRWRSCWAGRAWPRSSSGSRHGSTWSARDDPMA